MTDAELREWAEGLLAAHDPAQQGHAYERCALCSYTRHPCDTYGLAEALLERLP